MCFKCWRKGHISKTCRIKPGGQSSQSAGYRKGATQKGAVRYTAGEDEEDFGEDQEDFGIYSLYATEESTPKPSTQTRVDLLLNGHNVNMEVDTRSERSVISADMYCKLFSHVELEEIMSLKTSTQDVIPLLGEITVSVKYGSQEARLPLTVCKGLWPALLGQDWMRSIRLDWRSIFERAHTGNS